jgi:hypothetical protein
MQVPDRAWDRRAFRHQTGYRRMPTRTGGLYFDEKNPKITCFKKTIYKTCIIMRYVRNRR